MKRPKRGSRSYRGAGAHKVPSRNGVLLASPTDSNDRRVLSPRELLATADDDYGILRLRISRDVLPGGYMAAMAPLD